MRLRAVRWGAVEGAPGWGTATANVGHPLHVPPGSTRGEPEEKGTWGQASSGAELPTWPPPPQYAVAVPRGGRHGDQRWPGSHGQRSLRRRLPNPQGSRPRVCSWPRPRAEPFRENTPGRSSHAWWQPHHGEMLAQHEVEAHWHKAAVTGTTTAGRRYSSRLSHAGDYNNMLRLIGFLPARERTATITPGSAVGLQHGPREFPSVST